MNVAPACRGETLSLVTPPGLLGSLRSIRFPSRCAPRSPAVDLESKHTRYFAPVDLPSEPIVSQAADTIVTEHFLLDKDVDVPMRDGAHLKADVFRPKEEVPVPALLNFGPYQKDKSWTPPPNLEEKPNHWMNWETVNPEWWVPRGYASVQVDARGSGKSPG